MKIHKLVLASIICLLLSSGVVAQATLIARGSAWKYLDNGSNQGTAWTATGFNDLGWASGNAQLGYGDGDEATVVSYGPNSSAKYITTYFRRSFNITNPADFSGLTLNILRDDGAVVYLNGAEVFRTNMPTGTIGYQTPATVAVSGAEETTAFIQTSINPSSLVAGANVLAVEIHQNAGTSSDISFDLDLIGQSVPAPPGTLVARGSNWKYLDNGSNQGAAWTAPAFNDSSWAAGNAQLGYGDGDEATVVSYGPNANAKFITTYFRRSFNVASPADFSSLTLNILRDDGAVVYINGTEVFRTNMPGGAVDYLTPASVAIGGAEETTLYIEAALNTSSLVAGTNVIAVEIHQSGGTSSDLSFDLDLIGNSGTPTPTVTRGPYLQMGTSNAMTVRWRTNIATDSRVQFGTTQGSLSQTIDDPNVTSEHEVRLTGLNPGTKYFYSVGTTGQALAGNDANHFFVTSPNIGQTNPYRIWILGDSGTADANAAAVRNAYLSFTGTTYTNLLLMLGDNAYENGTDAEYQAAVFNMYPTVMRQTPLWPTIGNHDTASSTNPPSSLPYFQMFTLPTGAEAGGVASGTEKYYSFNYGNIHFICLDSMTSSRSTTGAMLTWLQNDLAQNTQPWVIAYWHHPPYSKGSHNSDTETQLVEMRANVLPILESWGVDLVMAGHSHSYERSFLIDGHYGTSSTFSAGMKKNPGGGRENIDGAYRKSALSPVANEGAVYAIAGSSGKISGGALNHPAMFISLNNLGSLVMDVNNDRMDVKFLRENGTIADYFTMIKGSPPPPAPPNPPNGLTAVTASSSSINLSWTDGSSDESGFKVERSTDGTNFSEIATLGANTTSYAAGSLTASTQYFFRVRAFNAAGNSQYSNTATATTSAPAPTVPAAPSALTAAAVSTSRIDLSWTDNSSNETGFRIQRCKGSTCTNFSQIATVGPNVTSYSSTGLSRNSVYRYRVRAYNSAGNSAYSNIASARTF